MDVSSTWVWVAILSVGLILLWWVWTKNHSAQGGMMVTIQETIRGWLNAVGREEYAKEEIRLESMCQKLAERLTQAENELTHQGRLEDLSVDLRRRLNRLEAPGLQGHAEDQTSQGSVPRTVLRFGVRVTLSDFIWKDLGIVPSWDLTDSQIDKVVRGPFCRNCLHSLVESNFLQGERRVRPQCLHCSLSWREPSESSMMTLPQFKRELYDLLDTEYRNTGRIGIREEL